MRFNLEIPMIPIRLMRLSFSKVIKRPLKMLVSPLAALFLYVLWLTIRCEKNEIKNIDYSEPVIGAFWHGRQLMLAPLFRAAKLPRRASILISAHADGRMIANAFDILDWNLWLGLQAVVA